MTKVLIFNILLLILKEIKAVRLAVQSFLPHLVGRQVLLHADNHVAVHISSHLTTRLPFLITELRKLRYLFNVHDIRLRVCAIYTPFAANTWADILSLEMDDSDWAVNPCTFWYVDRLWGPRTIDRLVTMENSVVPRYTSRGQDPRTEAVVSLVVVRAAGRHVARGGQLVHPQVAAPAGRGHRALAVARCGHGARAGIRMARASLAAAAHRHGHPCAALPSPSCDMFYPGRRGVRIGPQRWSVTLFRLPFRRFSTHASASAGHAWSRRRGSADSARYDAPRAREARRAVARADTIYRRTYRNPRAWAATMRPILLRMLSGVGRILLRMLSGVDIAAGGLHVRYAKAVVDQGPRSPRR